MYKDEFIQEFRNEVEQPHVLGLIFKRKELKPYFEEEKIPPLTLVQNLITDYVKRAKSPPKPGIDVPNNGDIKVKDLDLRRFETLISKLGETVNKIQCSPVTSVIGSDSLRTDMCISEKEQGLLRKTHKRFSHLVKDFANISLDGQKIQDIVLLMIQKIDFYLLDNFISDCLFSKPISSEKTNGRYISISEFQLMEMSDPVLEKHLSEIFAYQNQTKIGKRRDVFVPVRTVGQITGELDQFDLYVLIDKEELMKQLKDLDNPFSNFPFPKASGVVSWKLNNDETPDSMRNLFCKDENDVMKLVNPFSGISDRNTLFLLYGVLDLVIHILCLMIKSTGSYNHGREWTSVKNDFFPYIGHIIF